MSPAQSQPPPRRAHLDGLTGIRGIAAWMVVLYHIRFSLVTILPDKAIAVLGKGYLAVDLFFILSGFVLWYNYAERLRAGGFAEVLPFMWRRIARIWPLHLFILTIFVAFALVLLMTGRDTAGYPFAQLPLQVFLVQNWGFTNELTWNNPAWSISTELAAYLLFPLVVCAVRWERLPLAALLGLSAMLAAALYAVFAFNGATDLGADISHMGLWRCLLEFSLGNVACMLWLSWRRWRHSAALVGLACAGFLIAGLAFSLPETMFVPATFVAGILALALGRSVVARALAAPPIRYLGEISYSTYLSHTLLFIVFKLLFVDRSLQIGWTGLAAFLALALMASVLLYHGIERPAQRWMNQHRPQRPPAHKAVPAE